MEEDAWSLISNAKINVDGETSDSNNTADYAYPANKRPKLESNASASVAKFKGVVLQHNGHWGAQIYANHQRIWLGTFKSEEAAAMAYDSAAIRLRSGDPHRNFPFTDCTAKEQNFQQIYSTEVVLDMIRDGTYQSKFSHFLRTQTQKAESGEIMNTKQTRMHGNEQFSFTPLFQKELTPSDVGKLNRLVIPKKYAVKYFPDICENVEENGINGGGGGADDTELVFYDNLLRTWKFRYCYWRSSQSFVFTRGWNRFVKAKELKANDIITFYTCESLERENKGHKFCLIDVGYYNGGLDQQGHVGDGVSQNVALQLNLGGNVSCKIDEEIEEFKQEKGSTHDLVEKGFRLFGAQIN